MIMKKTYVSINNLFKEYVWQESYQYVDERNELPRVLKTEKHRPNQLALFSPAVERFYRNRDSSWDVFEVVAGINSKFKRPFVRDTSGTTRKRLPEYGFDKSERLALVCDEEDSNRGIVSVRYSLVPLRAGEYKEIDKPEDRQEYGWLNIFEGLVKNKILNLEDVIIELVARKGEIDVAKINSRK